MSGFAVPSSRPWVGTAGAADTPPQPDDARAAASSSVKGGGGGVDAAAPTNASAISFGFAATAVLVSLFLLIAIFEHLIKPGLASSSSAGTGTGSSRSRRDEDDSNGDGNGLPSARRQQRHPRDGSPPEKLCHSPKVKDPVTGAADLPVLMPGQRYPTFLAQPAPLPLPPPPCPFPCPCPREGVWWPPHEQRHSFVPP